MKKIIWTILIVLTAGLIGGYSIAYFHQRQLDFNNNIVNGKTALENKSYTAAEKYFSRASQLNSGDEEAPILLNQTKLFVKADAELDSNEFTGALIDFKSVQDTKNGSQTLKQRSKQQISLINHIKSKYKKFNADLKQAQKQNLAFDFYGSNATLNKMFDDQDFNQKYYSVIYDQAKMLQQYNNDKMLASENALKAQPVVPKVDKKVAPTINKNAQKHSTVKSEAPKKENSKSSSSESSSQKVSSSTSQEESKENDSSKS